MLRAAAVDGCAQIRIPSGAAGGPDVLATARIAGLERVAYRCVKPPTAWKGTPAQTMLDLASFSSATVFYSASAREAAYPPLVHVKALPGERPMISGVSAGSAGARRAAISPPDRRMDPSRG